MSIYRTAVNNPVTTTLVFIAFAIFGVYSLMKTSIALFPDFDANVIMVMSSYPGTNAEDIETNLTKVLENSINGVSHLKELTSTSQENYSMLVITFDYGTDIDAATNDVRDKLDMVSQNLPDGASTPVIFKFSPDDLPILVMSATAEESLPGLDRILDDMVATPLARINGVGTVSVSGAPTREIQVYCDPIKLQAYGLSVDRISQIIAAENRNIPSGSIDIGQETYSLRVQKEFDEPTELLDVVVGYNGSNAIFLRDVATVIDGQAEKEQESYSMGRRSAQIVIQKQTGANTVDVIRDVLAQMEVIKKDLPSDIQIRTIIDSSENIINTIGTLEETIMITFIVVMLVVFIFLGRWRATFIIVLSIPLALLASLVYLYATGGTLNIISMASLSIAIGMVVDDAIVVLENVSTHLERGEKPKEAAVHATGEVGISVIASTLTMLCVFMPLTQISGIAGILFEPLGWIVSLIMIVSTTAALTLVPMLCSRFLRAGHSSGRFYDVVFGPINRFLDAISHAYSRLIAWAVTHRKTVIFGAFGIFVAVMVLLGPGLKTEFFPQNDQGRLQVTINLPVGTSQEVTGQFAEQFFQRVQELVPEIVIASYSFGQADTDNAYASMQANGSNIITMNINVGSIEKRKRTTAQLADIIRGEIDRYPEIAKGQVTEGMGGMGGAPSIKLEIYGYDFDTSDRVAAELIDKLKGTGIFTQVTASRDEYTPEYQVDFDRTKLALNGLNSSTAAVALASAMSGSVGSFYRENGDEYNIRVRYAPEFRTSIEDIENVLVWTPAGKAIRIKDLGKVVETRFPPKIERKNRTRVLTITAIPGQGYVLSDGVEAAQKCLDETEIPPEFTTAIGGDYEDQQDMFVDMFTLMILIVILVYMVMASQFESFMSPFVIMFSVPFAFVGVLIGLRVGGIALGMMSMVGVLILLGIVVKNGIVLIDYTILNRERGMNVVDASVSAAKSRLRPILMTTLTTVLGMLPMAMGTGEGAETWRSLGVTVCWGLSISTLITLVLIPTIYCVFATRQEKRAARKAAERAQLIDNE